MKNKTMTYILEQLQQLTAIPSPSGFTKQAVEYLMQELKLLGYKPETTVKGGVLVSLGGKNKENALLLSAHLDTLGGMVSNIKKNGKLCISPIGGLEANNTETENCLIYTRYNGVYSGTMQLNNASVHVNKEYAKQQRNFDNVEIVLDEKVFTQTDTEKLGISIGDYVCFDPRTIVTEQGFIKSRFLDDKLSVAILLGYAKLLKEKKVIPERQIYIHFTVYEEVGHGGAASVPAGVTEMLAVDMGCVGEGLNCNEYMVSICAKDSRGPSDYNMVTKLVDAAKLYDIDYALDVYPFYGSDADVALMAGNDIKHALIGAGVYASHGYERSHIDGVSNTLKLIDAYIAEDNKNKT